MRICVLGAGIIGLASAWELHRQGHEVTVLDRGQPGMGTSGGNGAQLSYSYVAPLADASIWRQLPALLLSPASPLKVRPQLDLLQWRWARQFLNACNDTTARQTTATLLTLAAESRLAFEAMQREVTAPCDFSATGKLVLYRSRASLAGAERQLQLQRALGSEQQLLTPQECVAIEPALHGYHREIAGAVYTPSECAVDSLQLCQALAAALIARGVRVMTETTVRGFERRGERVAAVRTDQGLLEADAFVLALGPSAHAAGRQLGVYLPIYPLKGYSITLNTRPGREVAPQVSITDSARKVVFARLGDRLRVAGMAELVGEDQNIRADRIATLVAATRALFPHASTFDTLGAWSGLRPATPTGVPLLGILPGAPKNVLFNVGHGALGLTLAFGSARRIAAAALPLADAAR